MIKLTEKYGLIFIGSLFALLVLNIIFIRIISNNPVMMGDEPYYHIRIASTFLKEGIFSEDKMVYGWRPYVFNPYHFILLTTFYIFGSLSAFILPLLIGFCSLYFLYCILTEFNLALKSKLVFMLFYVFSPIFLHSLFISNTAGTALLFQLAGFWLYQKQTKKTLLLAILLFTISSFFGITYLLIMLAFLGIYAVYDKKKAPHFYFMVFIFSIIAFLFYLPLIGENGVPTLQLQQPYLVNFITDFGAEIGITIFALALAVLGFIRLWVKNKEAVLLLALLIIISTAFFGINYVYTNLLVSFFAGLGFLYISKSTWKLQGLKNISLILILLGLFLSTTSFLVRFSETLPSQDLVQVMECLKNNSDKTDFVFSDARNGFWIEHLAQRPVITDTLLKTTLTKEKFNDINLIIQSYDLNKVLALLENYNVKHLLITPSMDENLHEDEKRLIHLLKNNETFKKICDTGTVRLYTIKDYDLLN